MSKVNYNTVCYVLIISALYMLCGGAQGEVLPMSTQSPSSHGQLRGVDGFTHDTRSLADNNAVVEEDDDDDGGSGGGGIDGSGGSADGDDSTSPPTHTPAHSLQHQQRASVRASWPGFQPTPAGRRVNSWKDDDKDITPVLATRDGSIQCWSDRDGRSFPRYQSFCFVKRLCYKPSPGKGKKQWYLPLPDFDDAGVDLTPLTSQREIPTGPAAAVDGFRQSDKVVFVHGSRTHHFPEWIDGPTFLFAYQMHAWEFGLPRVTAYFDHRHKNGVMSWVNGVTEMVMETTGVRKLYNQWKPPNRKTCYNGVFNFAAKLEADAFYTRRGKHNRREFKYEAGPRRHFFYPLDGVIWHYTAVQYAQGTLQRRDCCHTSIDYEELAGTAMDMLFESLSAEQRALDAALDGGAMEAAALNITLLQRGPGNGRRFYEPEKLQTCLADSVSSRMGLPPDNVKARVVSWEGASLAQQISEVSASTVFMAAHGAGGVNYLWLQPCSIFVDAFPFNHFSPHFYGPPAENLGAVYSYTNFVPPVKHMAKCFPKSVKKAGMSYTCMKLMDSSCRSCARHKGYLIVPCDKLSLVLEYALLRRQQCLNEIAQGLRPESRRGSMYFAHGGRSMEFEIEEEVFDADRLQTLIGKARALGPGDARMYPAVPPVVTPQQLLAAFEAGNNPNSVQLTRPGTHENAQGEVDDGESV